MADRYPNANSRNVHRFGTLAKINDQLAEDSPSNATVSLHPTKGYRFNSVKRSRASGLVDFIKAGRIPYRLDLCQRVLREGF